jgi:flagellin
MAVIGYNAAAVNAAYYLNQNTNNLNSAIQELSSGSRISDPSNDAAGVAADGFLSTIQQQLSRMSELAQSATNGSFGSSDLSDYNTEFQDLYAQISTIFTNADFDGAKIFSGAGASGITVAIDASGTTDSLAALTVTNITTGLGLSASDISTTTSAGSMITSLNTAIQSLTSSRAQINADISKFNFYVQNQETESTNLQAANSRIADVDVASESTMLAQDNILQQASTSMLAQANSSQNSLLSLLK